MVHYVVLMGEAGTMRVAAIIVANADAHVRALSDSKIVAATERYGELRKHVRQQALSADFWFKLLTLGGKLFGGA